MDSNFITSVTTTTGVCRGMLQAALAQNGFEVNCSKSYLEAYNSEQALAILPVCRCLSTPTSGEKETTTIRATRAGVLNLMKAYGLQNAEQILSGEISDFNVIVGNAELPGTLCIGFCTAKYSFADVDITVVPLKTILEKAQTGGVYSIAEKTGAFHYDYAKAGEGTPGGAILRNTFLCK